MRTITTELKPVDKLFNFGVRQLSNKELLSILVNTGTKDTSAEQIACKLLTEFNYDLNSLFKQNHFDLIHLKGIGQQKAALLSAAFELCRRKIAFESQRSNLINSSEVAFELLFPEFLYLEHEEFKVALMNRNNRLIRILTISKGGIAGTVVDPRVIFKLALRHNATGMVLAHNHPSGNLKPSREDISITNKVLEAGENLDIKIHDHLIIYDQQYFSFADEGLI